MKNLMAALLLLVGCRGLKPPPKSKTVFSVDCLEAGKGWSGRRNYTASTIGFDDDGFSYFTESGEWGNCKSAQVSLVTLYKHTTTEAKEEWTRYEN